MSQPKDPALTKAQPKRTSLKKGALLNWTSLSLYFVSAFVITPIIIKKLGNSGYGTWALIQSFSGYYGLVNLGFGSALLRSIGHDLAKNDLVSLQTTVSTAVRFFSVTGGTILVLAATLGLPAASFFNLPPAEAPWFAITLLLAAGAIVTDFFGAINTGFLNSAERFDWLNYLSIGRQFFQTTGTLIVLWVQPSITGVAAVMFTTSLAAIGISNHLARRISPEISLFKKGFTYTRLKELLGYGGGTVMLTISNLVRLRLGNLIIAKFSGVAAVASYNVAVSLITNFNSILSTSMGVLNSRFTRLNAQSNHEELARLYRGALFVSAAMAFGVGTGMLLFGGRFIVFWVGSNLPESAPVLYILLAAYMIALAQSPSWNLMFALSKHHFMARVSAIEAAVNLCFGLWLSQRYGAIGFAWATSGTMLLTKIFIHPAYGARIGGVSLNSYLAPMAYPFLCSAVLGLAAYFGGLIPALQNHGLLFFVVSGCLYVAAYAGLLLLFTRRKDYLPPFVAKQLERMEQTAGALLPFGKARAARREIPPSRQANHKQPL